MYDLGYNLIIADDDYTNLGSTVTTMALTLEDKLTDYNASLSRIIAGAVTQGDLSENLATFQTTAAGLKGEANRLAQQLRQILADYVSETEVKDKNASYNKTLRDQAKVHFEMAQQNGLGVRYHFVRPPDPRFIRQLEEYSERYTVPFTYEVGPI